MSRNRPRLLALFAVAIAVGAAVTSLVVWDYGRVNLGISLREEGGRVVVDDVTPGGIAHRAGFTPGITVLDIRTVDGIGVRRGEAIGTARDGMLNPRDADPWEILWPVGGEMRAFDSDYQLPSEAVEPARIDTVVAGVVEPGHVNPYAVVSRGQAEAQLNTSIWLAVFGMGLAASAWLVLRHLAPGESARRFPLTVAAAIATPFVLAPTVAAGTAAGIMGGYIAPIALALLVGLSYSGAGPRNTGTAVIAVAVSALAILTVVQWVASPSLEGGEPALVYILAALAAGIPAFVAGARRHTIRERAEATTIGLVPVAALSALSATNPQPIFPTILLLGLIGWQAIPARTISIVDRLWQATRPRLDRAAVQPPDALGRDVALIALAAIVVAVGMPQINGVWAGIAAATGILVAWAWRAGLFGADWTDAAAPIAASVTVPLAIASFGELGVGGGMAWAAAAIAAAALGVAHALAIRHDDAVWQGRLFVGAAALAISASIIGAVHEGIGILAAAMVPLIPGLPIAFAADDGASRLTTRLEALAVALTPAVAATGLILSTNGAILWTWLIAIVIWRQFTLKPLVGLAIRTQMQRDLAVAAAETERARLAADLHDDALQQLTMLVRTLDEKGQKPEADEAREIATKLRGVVGDLRLPILDDLGAGAALEWLVERVEPLAGGPVKLERSDETRPPASVELAVFRVAQEALTNAIKHGRPPIDVRYEVRADGRVTLAIDDAGEGIGTDAAEDATQEGHFGLVNMQQRAEQIGALLDVRRWPTGGTRVALEWRPQ